MGRNHVFIIAKFYPTQQYQPCCIKRRDAKYMAEKWYETREECQASVDRGNTAERWANGVKTTFENLKIGDRFFDKGLNDVFTVSGKADGRLVLVEELPLDFDDEGAGYLVVGSKNATP